MHIINVVIKMVSMTLSIPAPLAQRMKKHSELNWSDVARQAIKQKIRDLDLLDKLVAKSQMTNKDVEELDEIIKKGLWQRHKELMKA